MKFRNRSILSIGCETVNDYHATELGVGWGRMRIKTLQIPLSYQGLVVSFGQVVFSLFCGLVNFQSSNIVKFKCLTGIFCFFMGEQFAKVLTLPLGNMHSSVSCGWIRSVVLQQCSHKLLCFSWFLTVCDHDKSALLLTLKKVTFS